MSIKNLSRPDSINSTMNCNNNGKIHNSLEMGIVSGCDKF